MIPGGNFFPFVSIPKLDWRIVQYENAVASSRKESHVVYCSL